SSSEGWEVADRIWTIVMMGQTTHSTPRNRVDQAQTKPIVRARHRRKLAVAPMTSSASRPDNASHASQAPTATTRLPSAVFNCGVQSLATRQNRCLFEIDESRPPKITTGCSKRSSGKAAASEEAKRTLFCTLSL